MEKNIWVISQSNSHILTKILSDNFIMLGLAERIKIVDDLDDVFSLRKTLQEIATVKDAVVYYIFESAELYDITSKFCGENSIVCFNIHRLAFTFFYKTIAARLSGQQYSRQVAEEIDKSFIEFAVSTDDGKDLESIRHADVVIIGISRTTKTPLSMYLSNHGIKVANVPLVPEVSLPETLEKFPKDRVFALTMDSERLSKIRRERLKYLGLPQDSMYASLSRIEDEIRYANKVVEKLGCRTVDVSSLSIEETADVIKNMLQRNV